MPTAKISFLLIVVFMSVANDSRAEDLPCKEFRLDKPGGSLHFVKHYDQDAYVESMTPDPEPEK